MRALAVLALSLCGCAKLSPVTDGTSLSHGATGAGSLRNPARLPVKGDGYQIPQTWAKRGLNFGTEELVGAVVRASRRVAREQPGATLWVADLSPRVGGPSAWHRSHQTGRDADLHFFLTDDEGKPAPAPVSMIQLGEDGATPAVDAAGQPLARLHFDTGRNWALVRALVEDPVADVQFLFVATWLEKLLIDHAVALGEPAELRERAAFLLHQPGDSLPHDDHLHLRIYCPANDRSLGCDDRGPLRWFKKSYKYLHARAGSAAPVPEGAAEAARRPFCRFLTRRVLAYL